MASERDASIVVAVLRTYSGSITAVLLFATSVGGCALREVSPGHYVLGMKQGEETAANAPAPAAAPAAAPAPAATSAPAAGSPQPLAQAPSPPAATTVNSPSPHAGAHHGKNAALVATPATPSAKIVSPDVAIAAKAGVDLSVFGIRLGEPLNLAVCPQQDHGGLGVLQDTMQKLSAAQRAGDTMEDGDPEPLVDNTCQPRGFYASALLNRIQQGGGGSVDGADYLLAQVPKDKCPAWLRAGRWRCTLKVAVKDGLVVESSFPVGGETWQSTIDTALMKKYAGRSADTSEVTSCKRRELGLVTQTAKVRAWSMPGLHVRFNPLGGYCASDNTAGTGWVSVELASFADERQAAEERARAAEPGM